MVIKFSGQRGCANRGQWPSGGICSMHQTYSQMLHPGSLTLVGPLWALGQITSLTLDLPPSSCLALSSCDAHSTHGEEIPRLLLSLCVHWCFVFYQPPSPRPITNTGSCCRRVEQSRARAKKSTGALHGQALTKGLWPGLDMTPNICWDVGLTASAC